MKRKCIYFNEILLCFWEMREVYCGIAQRWHLLGPFHKSTHTIIACTTVGYISNTSTFFSLQLVFFHRIINNLLLLNNNMCHYNLECRNNPILTTIWGELYQTLCSAQLVHVSWRSCCFKAQFLYQVQPDWVIMFDS